MIQPKDVFKQYLRDKNIRHSKQRDTVFDVFLKTEKHITIAGLYDIVRKKDPRIGFATVHRAMKVMCDAGLASRFNLEEGAAYYEHAYGHDHHDHLICLKCSRFIEVVNQDIERLQGQIARVHGFIPLRHKLQIYGVCKKCVDQSNRGN